ncbi:TPA: hypothetical protein ACH3X3_004175 [Trebouxia sp. C0006]
MAPQGSQDMASAQKDLAPAIAQAAPTPVVAINGSPAHDRAARRQPITFDLGNCRLPQPGHGFVTRSLPRAVAQGKYKTPPSGEWVTYENAASGDRMHQAQAAKRVLQGADAEAASVPGGANGSALGVLSPRGGGHTPQNTPEFLAMLHDNELFEPEAGTQASEQPHVSGSGRDLGMLRVMSLDGVAHQASPAGIPGDGISFSTPAASSGLGVHGGFVQNYGEGQMPAGISPGAQGNDGMPAVGGSSNDVMTTLVYMSKATLGHPPAGAKASSIPTASFGPTAAPAASSAASLAAAESIAGPAAAPTTVASVAEEVAVPSAASLVDAGLSASLVPPSAAAAGTDGQGMSLDGVAQQPSAAGDNSAFGTPTTGISPGYGHILISTHGGGHMPTGMSPGYVMRTPDFCLPVLTPLPSTFPSQHRRHFVPNQDSAVAQPASSLGAASQATAGASLISVGFPGQLAEAPAVSSATSNAAVGSPAGPAAAPTSSTTVASVQAAEITGDHLFPCQLQCSKKQKQTPEEDAAMSGAAAAPQQAAATQPTVQLAGTNPFTMGVDQPNKRVADEAGKKGKPARKAAASIQSTVGPSKPTDATAHSSSSSSSILPAQEMPHGGGGQSGAAPAEPSSLEPTGAAQQAAPAAQRSAQMLPPLPRPGKRSRTDNTCQADPNYPPPLMSQASSGASPVLQKRKGPSRHPPLKATPLLMKKKPRGRWLGVEKSKGKELWWITVRVALHLLRKLHQLCHWAACYQGLSASPRAQLSSRPIGARGTSPTPPS